MVSCMAFPPREVRADVGNMKDLRVGWRIKKKGPEWAWWGGDERNKEAIMNLDKSKNYARE